MPLDTAFAALAMLAAGLATVALSAPIRRKKRSEDPPSDPAPEGEARDAWNQRSAAHTAKFLACERGVGLQSVSQVVRDQLIGATAYAPETKIANPSGTWRSIPHGEGKFSLVTRASPGILAGRVEDLS